MTIQEQEATETVEVAELGSPMPTSWQVHQMQGTRDGETIMLVKLILASPAGLHVAFFEGDEAQLMASSLKKAGRAATAGIWQGSSAPTVRPSKRTNG